MRTILWIACLVWLSAVTAASGNQVRPVTTEQIENWARSELPIRSSAPKAETFLKRHKFEFSFDRFSSRYQALIRLSKYHAVGILVNVGKNQTVTGFEVHESFTGP